MQTSAGGSPASSSGGGAGGSAGGSPSSSTGTGGAVGADGGGPPAAGGGPAQAVGGSSGTGAGGGLGTAGGAGGPAFVDLFNGTDLTGFNVYQETTEQHPGTLLTGAAALKFFKPENNTIHVYGDEPDQAPEVHYTMMTVKSYSNYNLTWDYKWGTKKFGPPPYNDVTKFPRDAGVLWHIHADLTQLWPSSIEFQNKDGTTGDIFALYARCTSPGSAADKTVFAEGGASVLVDGSTGFVQHSRSANFEIANDWNSLRLEVNNSAAVYYVNGHIVNRVLSVMDKTGKPVTSGPVAWQGEQAEVFYRNLRIQVLQ